MRSFLLFLAAGLVFASPGFAQTRLAVAAGGVVPFGDLGDVADPSVAGGLRLEIQPVNALGQRRLLAFTFSGTYSSLGASSEQEAALALTGESTDSDLLQLDAGIGVCGKDGQSVPVGVGQPTLKLDELVVGGTET